MNSLRQRFILDGKVIGDISTAKDRKGFYINGNLIFCFDGELARETSMIEPEDAWVIRYEVREKYSSGPEPKLYKKWTLISKRDGGCLAKGLADFGVSSKHVVYHVSRKTIEEKDTMQNGEFKNSYGYLRDGKYLLRNFSKIIEFSNGAFFARKRWDEIGMIYSPDLRPIKPAYIAYEGYMNKNPDETKAFVRTPNNIFFAVDRAMKNNMSAIMSADGQKILVDDKRSIKQITDRIYYVVDDGNADAARNTYHAVLTPDRNGLAVPGEVRSPTLIGDKWIHYTLVYNFRNIVNYTDDFFLKTQFIGEFDKTGKMTGRPMDLISMNDQELISWAVKILAARKIQAKIAKPADSEWVPYWLGGKMMNEMLPRRLADKALEILRDRTI